MAAQTISRRGDYTYRTASSLRHKGPTDAYGECLRFGGLATTEAAKRFLNYAVSLTPIGGVMSKVRRGRAPGTLQRGWRMHGENLSAGRVYAIANVAPHAGPINYGRKRNKKAYRVRLVNVDRRFRKNASWRSKGFYTVPAKRRFIGSRLAPGGLVRPAWRRLKRDEQEVSRIAIRKAEGGGI